VHSDWLRYTRQNRKLTSDPHAVPWVRILAETYFHALCDVILLITALFLVIYKCVVVVVVVAAAFVV
jgi:hypothetical protein